MKLTKSRLQHIIKEEFQALFKEDRQAHITGIQAKIGRLELEVERIEDALEAREAEVDSLPDYPEKEYELRDLRTTPEYFEMTSRRNRMEEKIEELESQMRELSGENLEEEKEDDLHFSPSQSPTEADETYHQCMIDVDVEPDPGVDKDTAKARICTDTRKASGATLDWGEKREKEVQRAREGGKSGNEDQD